MPSSDPIAHLNASLTGRYTVERELGAGGMATVYLARDLRHNRNVAIKVLSPDLGASLGAERFLREIAIAAGLTHPHILPLHDSGAADDLLFYVMPHVEGESLRDRLNRERQLPIAEALQITREVGAALDYAHRKGVVHRDIKPENILLQDGHALVADFGIARAVAQAGGQTLTATGLALGTPAYMSPEQAAAEHEVDGRSDQYALASVLYEMLAGEPPYIGATSQAIIAKRFSAPVPDVRTLRESVPPGVGAAITRALAKSPVDRFPTVDAFVSVLDRPPSEAFDTIDGERRSRASRSASRRSRWIVVASTVAATVGALWAVWALEHRGGSSAAVKTLAVLPFENTAGDSAQEYFSEGMTDEVANAIAAVPNVRVTARSSSHWFKGRQATPQDIGERLRVAYLVEGTVRRLGDKLHVSVDLVNTKDGLSMWSHAYDRKTKDVYDVQHEITSAIVGALQERLRSGVSTGHHETANVEAHDLYLRARFAIDHTGDLWKALDYLKQATAKDSSYALAYAGIGEAYEALADNVLPPDSANPLAEAAVQHALGLDSTLAEAYAVAAEIDIDYHWKFAAARRNLDRAHAINPSEPSSYLTEAGYWAAMRQPARAVQVMRRALVLDPVSPRFNNAASYAFVVANELDSALAHHRRWAAFDAAASKFDVEAGVAYLLKGRYAEAESAFKPFDGAKGDHAFRNRWRGLLYAREGRRPEAVAIARAIEGEWPKRYAVPEEIAELYAELGDRERMYYWLDKGISIHSGAAPTIAVSPFFQPYLREPRFKSLLKRIGIPDGP